VARFEAADPDYIDEMAQHYADMMHDDYYEEQWKANTINGGTSNERF